MEPNETRLIQYKDVQEPTLSLLNGQPSAFSPEQREQSVRRKTKKSFALWARSAQYLAGGVSSGLRRSARPYPLFFSHGKGSQLVDVDSNTYLDYTLGWGPNLLGNAPAEVIDSIQETIVRGLTFGAQHELEAEVAEMLTRTIPCADRVCFANSGTEIVQVALRLARAATGRHKFIKFEGHYHGWDDSVLQSYHPQAGQLHSDPQLPVSEGQGQVPASNTVIAQWNDPESVMRAFEDNRGEISALICEPLMCNNGCIAPEPGFLEFLRSITQQHGALLIFDEVITGFRLGPAGAQGYYGVTPDLATYAKAVGAGAPLSVLAGTELYMKLIESGQVIHAGTLNGNLIALAAARASLAFLLRDGAQIYTALMQNGERLRDGIHARLNRMGHAVCIAGVGSVFHIAFTEAQPRTYRDLLSVDKQKYSDFVLALLDEGVLPLPDGRWYVSTAHTSADVDSTLEAVANVLA